jgi:hypothetical protein
MPALQMPECVAMVLNYVAGVLDWATTAANYAERIATDLAVNVPSGSMARHSLEFGIMKSVLAWRRGAGCRVLSRERRSRR